MLSYTLGPEAGWRVGWAGPEASPAGGLKDWA